METKTSTNKTVTANTADSEIISAFKGPIEPVNVTPLYTIGLSMVAFMMVLLPLIYIVLIVATGYGMYYHCVENVTLLTTTNAGDSARGRALLYFGPIVIGAILILFMIKPLFAKRAKGPEYYVLDVTKASLLVAYIKKICSTVNAPIPTEIRLNCEVNASASFRRGFASFFSKDLVLTLGLPLISGFNTRQLAGVIAHEFGHFSQGLGMRLTYIIATVNIWFERVVYERDVMDEWLTKAAKEIDIRIGIILHSARFFVWLTRRILWMLMNIGHMISCFMMRQMEYDADKYTARVVGKHMIENSFKQLMLISTANNLAQHHLANSWEEKKLANNYPEFVMSCFSEISEEHKKAIIDHMYNAKTGFFNTHPSDKNRFENVNKETATPVFELELPSTQLFSNYNETAAEVALKYYRDVLGEQIQKDDLVSLETIHKHKQIIDEDYNSFDSYFKGLTCIANPIICDIEPEIN